MCHVLSLLCTRMLVSTHPPSLSPSFPSLDHLKYTSAACLVFLLFTTFVIFLYSLGDDELDPCDNQV